MLYFAYGTTLDRGEIAKACVKKGLPIPRLLNERAASLTGWSLKFNFFSPTQLGGSANMMFTGQAGDRVYGAVYDVTDIEMKIIDWKEGVATRSYERRNVEVVLTDGKRLSGVVAYTVIPAREMNQHVPPTQDYLSLIINNARRLGFPSEWVKKLEGIQTVER
jgi:gamma-glutamylcyclotransferase (GGCT)/AIG2-like uncharacterized protein YtfP